MKELSIEEKAKAYDEVVSKLKGFMAQGVDPLITRADVQDFFPELKESEDESIRKEIIAFLKENFETGRAEETWSLSGLERWIAWLEKQGEQKPYGQRKECSDCQFNYAGECKGSCQMKRGEQKSADSYCQESCKGFQETGKCFADGDCKAKREAESVDKFEPKFHEGDWIVQGYNILKIQCVGNTHYCFETVGGYVDDMLISEIDSQFHLWTIADAKNGDVLIEDSCIFIIQKLGDNSTAAKTYCTLYNDGDFNDGSILYFDIDSTKPATKEQRDTLEKAMANAGYTFDFERKELRKLGQSEVTKMSDQEEIAEIPFGAKDSELQEATYFIPKGFHAEIDDDKVVIKQGEKPTAWSEEDEQITLSIEQAMNCASLLNVAPEKIDKIRTWLKSLKDRYTWKPTEEQIRALHDLNLTGNISYGGQGQVLIELYNNLKKLTE